MGEVRMDLLEHYAELSVSSLSSSPFLFIFTIQYFSSVYSWRHFQDITPVRKIKLGLQELNLNNTRNKGQCQQRKTQSRACDFQSFLIMSLSVLAGSLADPTSLLLDVFARPYFLMLFKSL